MSEMFGNSVAEKNLQKIVTAREIVKEISNCGLTQEQIVLVIQFLAYELENHEQMVEVVALTKNILASMETSLFVERS